jgi:hypothetical protein
MGTELKLHEIGAGNVTKSTLELGSIRGDFGDALSALQAGGEAPPGNFWCPDSREPGYCKADIDGDGEEETFFGSIEEPHWGRCRLTGSGDEMVVVTAAEILDATSRFVGSEGGWPLPKKRGVYAYLSAVPGDTKFALDFH